VRRRGGLRLLDVGCGAGYFAREMARRGARVTGVDLSPRMVDHARAAEAAEPLGVEYVVGDAAALGALFPAGAFEMATACMSLQDVPDPASALAAVARALRPGARFVCSITHPCTDTPSREWLREPGGRKRALCVDRYFERVAIEYRWRGWGDDFTTPAVHAPVEDWVAWALAAGFAVAGLREPRPTPEAVRARPRSRTRRACRTTWCSTSCAPGPRRAERPPSATRARRGSPLGGARAAAARRAREPGAEQRVRARLGDHRRRAERDLADAAAVVAGPVGCGQRSASNRTYRASTAAKPNTCAG
jgi:SAM-dependent methyltransferase